MTIKEVAQNKYTKIIVGGLIILGVGFGIGKYSQPAKVITKTETKEVVKFVEKKEERKNVVVITDKVTKPDGTVIEHTETKDKTEINTDTNINIAKDTKTESTQIRDSGLSIQALAITKLDDFNNREYGVLVKKRIVGNISASALATHKGTIGIAVGLDF